MAQYLLHVLANCKGGGEEEFEFKTAYELDDMLGIMKTYMEYADHTSSFVFTVVREREDAAKEREVEERRLKEMDQWDSDGPLDDEQSLAYFDRYIAGDR